MRKGKNWYLTEATIRIVSKVRFQDVCGAEQIIGAAFKSFCQSGITQCGEEGKRTKLYLLEKYMNASCLMESMLKWVIFISSH